MPKSLTRALSVTALVFATVFGQATQTLASNVGNIIGRVTSVTTLTNKQIEELPLANVNVAAVAPSGTSKALTNAAGYYALTGLAVDTYAVSFAKQGYVTVLIPGVTVSQDATYPLNVRMQTALTSLGTVSVRGAQSLVQPNQPADRYTVTSTQIQNITGTPQNISETAVLNSLPGITTDTGGYPIIRGGAENDEGFQLEGIDATEPITGQFINSLSLSGTSRIVLETGGYDVTNGNTNSGVVNIVVKRGSYPGAGQATLASNAPNFDHRFAVEYGNGSPDNRFSYFVSYNGLRQFRIYGDQHTFLSQEVTAVGTGTATRATSTCSTAGVRTTAMSSSTSARMARTISGSITTCCNTAARQSAICPTLTNPPTCLPYDSANLQTRAFFGTTVAWSTTLLPGQAAYNQAINYADNENNNHFIEKLNYKRQFSSNSYADIGVFRTSVHDIFGVPWNGGFATGEYEFNHSDNTGVEFDYQNQISNQNLIAIGGTGKFSKTDFSIGIPMLEPLVEPNEFGYIGYINMAHGVGGCGTNGATPTCVSPAFPLSTYVPAFSFITDPVQTWDAFIQDTWTPTTQFNVKAGVRFDQQVLHLPSNAAALSTSYTHDAVGQHHRRPRTAGRLQRDAPLAIQPAARAHVHAQPKRTQRVPRFSRRVH